MAANDELKYTEVQHFAIVESAVARETSELAAKNTELDTQVASLTTEKASLEAERAELQTRVDVVEAEKSAAVAATAEVQAAFDAFKNELAEKAEKAARKSERVDAIKAANAGLAEDYFTEERAARWAEMSDEAFSTLIENLGAVTTTAKAETTEATATEQARETSAFKGGASPSAASGESSLRQLFTATGLAGARN